MDPQQSTKQAVVPSLGTRIEVVQDIDYGLSRIDYRGLTEWRAHWPAVVLHRAPPDFWKLTPPSPSTGDGGRVRVGVMRDGLGQKLDELQGQAFDMVLSQAPQLFAVPTDGGRWRCEHDGYYNLYACPDVELLAAMRSAARLSER